MAKLVSIMATLAMVFLTATGAHAYSVDLSNPQNYSNQVGSPPGQATATSSTLALSGNIWALITLDTPFTVQSNSTLTFTYSSTEMPEIAAVTFDTNTRFDHDPDQYHTFCFGGTDGFPPAGYIHPTPYMAGDGDVTYSFALAPVLGVGTTYNHLIFVNDDDHGGPLSNGYFTNVSLSATPIPGAVWLLGSGLVGLVGLRRRLRT